MEEFTNITKYYNQLMHGVPYSFWVSYIEAIFKKLNMEPKTILDIACGTGTVSHILTERDYSVTGFDLSQGMIKEAKKNYPNIDFSVQNAKNFTYNNTFDAAVCLFDSFNYITEKEDLQSSFKQVYKHLNSNGAFIFDMNTQFALENDLFAQICLNEDANPQYIWKPEWNPTTKICTVDMTFIVKENGQEREFKEVHIQRAYGISEIIYMLQYEGFNVINVYSAYRWTKPTKRSDRVFFVCIKK